MHQDEWVVMGSLFIALGCGGYSGLPNGHNRSHGNGPLQIHAADAKVSSNV
jgi:hypothetical protein